MRSLVRPTVLKLCPDALQHMLRRLHLTRLVAQDRIAHEDEVAWVRQMLRPGDVVVDVGANIGVYTRELSRLVGPTGTVLAFEPVPENYRILERVIHKTSLTNVHLFQAAVGEHVTEHDFLIPAGRGFSGYYLGHLVSRPGEPGRRLTVRVTSLDTLLRQGHLQELTFVKCDVEGGEPGVIAGAHDTLRLHRPAWLLEVSPRTAGQVFAALQAVGYHAFIWRSGPVEVADFRRGASPNVFFVHPDSAIGERVLKR